LIASIRAPISSVRTGQDSRFVQLHRGVERRLAAQGGQHRIRRSLAMTFSSTSSVIGST